MPGFREDVARYGGTTPLTALRAILQNQGLWALAVYRFFHPLVTHPSRAVRVGAAPVGAMATKLIEVLTGILLPNRTEIGPGVYIGHFGPVLVNERARIGRHFTVMQCTTIGNSGRLDRIGHDDAPVIGDRVYFGAGAVAIGRITIGNDCVVGANACVTKSLPARAVAVGSPARIASMRGSFDVIGYEGDGDDPERVESLEIARSGTEPIPDDPRLTPPVVR